MPQSLERTIMRMIGFSQEPESYPVESRKEIRLAAISKLARAINDQHQAGSAIAPAHEPFISLAREIANSEDPRTLNKTWGLCQEVILAHMMASYRQGAERKKFFNDRLEELRRYYRSPRGGSYFF